MARYLLAILIAVDAHVRDEVPDAEPRPYGGAINEPMARFWSQMVEDPNPIYFDEGYARTTWLGGRIAPPTLLMTWGASKSWPPPPPAPE